MVLLDCHLELTLENPLFNNDLSTAAAYFAQDALAQCVDVAAMAFPSGHKLPSEEMLANVALRQRNLVRGIECAVRGGRESESAADPVSWKLLMESGLLRDPALIDFCLAQFAADQLTVRILTNGDVPAVDQLPARLLNDQNSFIADAAKALLTSEAEIRRAPELVYRQLESDLLYRITWRITAALQIVSGEKDDAQVANAKQFLGSHDESNTVRSAARKIVYFLMGNSDQSTFDPAQTGIAVFAAGVSAATGIDHDHVLRLANSHSGAPLAMLLRASGVGRELAMDIICLFNGFNLTPLEVSYVDRHYDVVPVSDAKSVVAQWQVSRAMQLAFPGIGTNSE